MDAFLGLSADDQRAAYAEAATRTRLPAVSIEKDFWVCWTLRELFALPEIGPHLTFKGGTSLSKAWQLIERFSEDIDVVIDRDFLGFGGEHSPERAPSRTKQRQRLDKLKAANQAQIREALQPALADRIAEKLRPGSEWRLDSDPDDPDAQTLLFAYPTVFGEASYVTPRVIHGYRERDQAGACGPQPVRIVTRFPVRVLIDTQREETICPTRRRLGFAAPRS